MVRGVGSAGYTKTAHGLLFALVQAILLAFPVATMAPWLASDIALPPRGITRELDIGECHYYWWYKKERTAKWYLPEELRDIDGHQRIRILRYCADEGSSGWATYLYLATVCKMRIVFIRDPLHRLSNLYTRSLRAVPVVMMSTFATLMIQKFKRAPAGSGIFWTEAAWGNSMI